MAIDLRDEGVDRGRREPAGPRPTVFHDNGRVWLANLADIPALDVRLAVDDDIADDHQELLGGLAVRTLSAYEQRCVPAGGLPPAGVGLTVRWRDHLDREHAASYRVGRDAVSTVVPSSQLSPRPDPHDLQPTAR